MKSFKRGWFRHWWQLLAILSALLMHMPLQAAPSKDLELKRLEAQLEGATTQGDMNFAAGDLAKFWDSKLAAMEKKIERKLSKKERKEFSKSKKRWRSYRSKDVALDAKFFEGGSV